MIRQAISCDVCGAEKRQTNHWYVACEQGGELRLGGWNSRMRQRPGAKHLCGQTCLHKLVDEFIARASGARPGSAGAENSEPSAPRAETDASLTSAAAFAEVESSARLLIPSPAPSVGDSRPMLTVTAATVLPMQPRPAPGAALPVNAGPQIEDTPNYASRRWRAEAWERERNRELRGGERHGDARRHKMI